MGLDDLLDGVQIAAILCNQWGDSGKGKFSDYFAFSWADVIARGTGGNNAGHTVVVNGKEKIFHLLPSGILHDSLGKVNILGNGMVINLEVLSQELDELDSEGMSYNNLMISRDANVIMPYHVRRDKENLPPRVSTSFGLLAVNESIFIIILGIPHSFNGIIASGPASPTIAKVGRVTMPPAANPGA